MAKLSAGLLVYRQRDDGFELLVVHPGGPFWEKKDAGSWSVVKGEYVEPEDPWTVACREFEEELGMTPPPGPVIDLGAVRQAGGKTVRCFAVEGDVDVATIRSNEFTIEWPPRSGREQSFPEIDRAAWASTDAARRMLLKAQTAFVDRLVDALTTRRAPPV